MKSSARSALLSCLAVLAFASVAQAAPFSVLWFDATPEYSGQAPNAYRQEMADSLTATPGNVFVATYVDGMAAGSLAAALGVGAYDVVVLDATGSTFNAADIAALRAFYEAGNQNLLFDGSLYIRNINFSAQTDYPGPASAMDNFTRNEVHELATRGGGIFFGTDHNCCQAGINQLIAGILPGAQFSGIAAPNTQGTVYGTQLLASIDPVAPLDLLNHWSTEGSQGIPPSGTFTDVLGNSRTLYTQVDFPLIGTNQRFPFVTTSWEPGQGTIIITDPDPPDPQDPGTVPAPGAALLFVTGMFAVVARRRRG